MPASIPYVMHKMHPLYKNPDKLLSHCMTYSGRYVIKGSEVLTHSKSPFSFYCNHFVDPSKQDPPSDHIIDLAEKGIMHEDQIIDDEKESVLNTLGLENENQIAEEYRQLIPMNFKVLKIPTMREGFKVCLDKMINEKTKTLHNAPLLYLPAHILGKPDTLEKRKGKSLFGEHYYVVKEIKSAINITYSHILQSAFYTLLIGRIQQRFPKEFYIINGDREETSYLYSKYEQWLVRNLTDMMNILQKREKPPAFYNDVPYPWSGYGDEMAIKRGGPALIVGIKKKMAEVLKDGGFRTINDVAECNVEKLARLPRIGENKALNFKVQAQAIKHKKIIKKTDPVLPKRKTEIFLDFEGVRFPPHIYLIGMLIREKRKKNQYVSFLGKTGEQKMWREFVKFIKKQNDYVIYHWSKYETSQIKRMIKKHKTPKEITISIFDNMIDLHAVTTKSFAFPVHENSIKSIANKIGFFWKDPEINGFNVESLYEAYLNSRSFGKEYLQKILDYNKDDCEATLIVKDWLLKH